MIFLKLSNYLEFSLRVIKMEKGYNRNKGKYWIKKIETLPSSELKKIQLNRIKKIIKLVYEKIKFYKKKFDKAGIKPQDIDKFEDLQKIPFTTKQELRDNYPFGTLSVPIKKIIRIHATSGTTGKPTVACYTNKDIKTWSDIMARCMYTAGVRAKDIIQNAYGYGLFTGALGFHYGGELIGSTIIPTGSGNTQRQLMVMKDFGTTVLCSTPSYAAYLAEFAKDQGIDLKKEARIKLGLFGAEPWSDELRKKIEQEYGMSAIDFYGLAEIIGPGVAVECYRKEGLHLWCDHFYPEIIDPKTGEILEPGERGELVLTTLTKEGMPILRYRTKDLTNLNEEKCVCGRTHPRISRILGRSDDMMIIRGVNVFPSQIEHTLMSVEGVSPNYQIVQKMISRLNVEILDHILVRIEPEKIVWNNKENLNKLEKMISENLRSNLGLKIEVELIAPGSLPRSEGKAKRILKE
jgi:phenylacetate-CoA ligase